MADKPITPMTQEDADRIAKSNTDPEFKKRAKDAADKNEEKKK